MDYEEDQPIPQGYHVRTRVRRGLVGAGAGVLGGFWLLSFIIGVTGHAAYDSTYGSGDGGWPALYIPVAGPFVAISTLNADGAGTALLMVDGIAQTGGLAMLVLGIALPEKKLVRDNVGFELTKGVHVMPTFTGTGAGLLGTF